MLENTPHLLNPTVHYIHYHHLYHYHYHHHHHHHHAIRSRQDIRYGLYLGHNRSVSGRSAKSKKSPQSPAATAAATAAAYQGLIIAHGTVDSFHSTVFSGQTLSSLVKIQSSASGYNTHGPAVAVTGISWTVITDISIQRLTAGSCPH